MTLPPNAAPVYPAQPPQTRMSKSSLFSLISGILGCIPFITGLLAIVLGIVGFVRAGKPGVTGRWMAVVGGILGTISVVVWTISGFALFSFFLVVLGIMEAPKQTAHDFIKDLSQNNLAALRAHSTGITEAEMKNIGDIVRAQGDFIDTTFNNQNVKNSVAEFEGTAQFSKGTKRVRVSLILDGTEWKVNGFGIE